MKEEKWPQAEVHIRESLKLREKLLGETVRLVGVCLHHLAFIGHHEKDDAKAISLLRRATKIFRVPSETQLGLLQQSMTKLTTILEQQDEKEAAKEAAQMCVCSVVLYSVR
jgi:hypothetical protein